jgi:hypothetical protein
MKFGVGVLYKNLSLKRDFCKNRFSDSYTLLKEINVCVCVCVCARVCLCLSCPYFFYWFRWNWIKNTPTWCNCECCLLLAWQIYRLSCYNFQQEQEFRENFVIGSLMFLYFSPNFIRFVKSRRVKIGGTCGAHARKEIYLQDITGPTTNTARLSPRYESKTRGCHCSHWAHDDGRDNARNMLSCK